MKKILLIIPLCAVLVGLNAQNCVPDPNLPPDFIGVFPVAEWYEPCDTITPSDPAYLNCPYEFTYTAFAPATTDFNGIPITINDITVNSVTGLPSGLTYVCEPPSCVFPGGAGGCLKVTGTPDNTNAVGVYDLVIDATANTSLVPINVTFPPDPANNILGLPLCPYSVDLQPECAPATVDITFQVNMANETVDPAGVFLAGGSGFGAPGDNPMTDMGGGIWEITMTKEVGFSSHYTLLNGNCGDWSCKEDLSGLPCGDPANWNDRWLNPVMSDTTLMHCFAECTEDLSCPDLVVPVNVTFQVDMSETPPIGPIYVTGGSLDNWCGSCLEMTDPDGDNIFSYTMMLEPGTYEYKFNNGGWGGTEALDPTEDAACTLTTGNYTNRVATIGDMDTTLDPVCFNSCEACAPVSTDGNITFSVDMNEYGGAFTTAYVNGSFNGWCGDCNPLEDPDMDGVWEATLTLPLGDYEYKFTVDAWTDQENLTEGDPCTITLGGYTNRALSVAGDATLPTVCWNSCSACGATEADVTFSVDMSEYAVPFTTVYVSGAFNGWSGLDNPLSDPDMDGVWEGTYTLPIGMSEYKFTHDDWTGQEMLMPGGGSCTITQGNYTNRFVNVSVSETLPTVCWNSCDACGFVPPTEYEVTFQVDMNEYGMAFDTVQLNGSFNGWCGNCEPMTDDDMDGVYETTVTLTAGNYEYKFAVDNWTDQEFFAEGDPCTVTLGGFTNRSLTVAATETLDVVCWNSCNACDGSSNTGAVTFRVDMNEYTASFTEVQLNGSFNGWCGACTPMEDPDGDNVWEVTMNLPLDTIEYKFTVDNWGDQEFFTEGDPCTSTIDGFTNRTLPVEGDAVLDVVCWASCEACAPPPAATNVTFTVDMSQYGNAFTEVQLNGSFNNWCGSCNPMDDSDGDNVWTLTLPLNAGTYEYKFTVDNWSDQEEFADGDPCTSTIDNFVNRTLTVSTPDDLVLEEVCWNSCEACTISTDNLAFMQTFDIAPNPADNTVNIHLMLTESKSSTIRFVNVVGQTVLERQLDVLDTRLDLDVTNLTEGIYFVVFATDEGTAVRKLMIQR